MDGWTYLGLVAGFLTTLGFIPQMLKCLRTKQVDEVSILMPVVLSLGMFLWFLYGVVREDAAIVVWNGISIALNISLVGMILHYRKKQAAVTAW